MPGVSAAVHLTILVITPLVDDASWLRQHSSLPPWQPPTVPTLVVAPHPDDETLGAGALVATLRASDVPVTVVAATDGENCYDLPQDEREGIRRTREAEQERALSCLGVAADHLYRLRLTDSGLHLLEPEITAQLMKLAAPGMHMLAPWTGDFHPDHEACARAAVTVAHAKGLQLTYYFFWTWHRGDLATLEGLPLRRFQPDETALQAKRDALQEHRSQLEWPGCDPILPAHLLGPAAWPFEVFLPA